MLEKPAIEDEQISACLGTAYGIPAAEVEFLPLGADANTAVYRAAAGGADYFVKLRRGPFDETAVLLPRYLSEQGVRQVIAPLQTQNVGLWAEVDDYRLVLYPFIAGQDGYQVPLTESQWIELGAALRRIQSLALPPFLTNRIRRETFSTRWRDGVRSFLGRIEHEVYSDPAAVGLARFLKGKRQEVNDLLQRTDRLGGMLKANPPEFVLCHADLHGANLLVEPGGALYIVDWDEPIFAPKERDLMCAGSGLMGGWRTPQEEEALFYQGYGQVPVDPRALAYYRYERILMDIAAFCEQLLLSEGGGADREQSLRYLKSNFVPDGTLAIARRADRSGLII